jgi:hypothetical protein
MDTRELLIDSFSRTGEVVREVLEGLGVEDLSFRPDPEANSIGWLVWHLTRVQDDHLAGALGKEQLWLAAGWMERFGLPFAPEAHGYGQTSAEVAAVRVPAELLAGYNAAVAAETVRLLGEVSDGELDRVVDERWDPPVTLGVRLVSVLTDGLQHAGQAAYLRGLIQRQA